LENKEGLPDGVPHLVYISREKQHKHPHNYKAGAMNVLVRSFYAKFDCNDWGITLIILSVLRAISTTYFFTRGNLRHLFFKKRQAELIYAKEVYKIKGF
jgi:hypothetical protein